MDPLAGMDDSSTDDDTASQTTEDDPQVPENHATVPASASAGVRLQVVPQPPPRERPHYALRHILRGHTLSIASLKFSPDGELLASCGSSNLQSVWRLSYSVPLPGAETVVKIWSSGTGEFLRNLTGHTQGLSDIAWSSDSVYLASASDDTTIRIWNVETVGRLDYSLFHSREH